MRADKIYSLFCGISVVDTHAGRAVRPDALLDPSARYDVAFDCSLHDPTRRNGRHECVMHVEWIDMNADDADSVIVALNTAVTTIGGSRVDGLDRAACNVAESKILTALAAVVGHFAAQVPPAPPPAADGSPSTGDTASGQPSTSETPPA